MSEELKQVPVGDLHCQRDTFARQFTTTCIACSEKPNKKGLYEVKLYDTILFPEGGGQPADTGFIDNVQVYDVQRQKLAHVHYTKQPVPVGKEVQLTVDWKRRWDHVQQHSGQHLLSAVLEQAPYNIETVSWNMGEKKCYIELPTGTKKVEITPEMLARVETDVNDLILKNASVITHVQEADHKDTERPASLPADYVGGGIIRTIEIQHLDKNPCCGTHVTSLGQLQAVKILHTENVRGGNTRVFFLFGQRILDTLDSSYNISRQINALLTCPPEKFVDNIDKLQNQSKENLKKAKRLLELLAVYTVNDIEADLKEKTFAIVYKEDVDMEFLTMVANVVRDRKLLEEGTQKVIVLAAGEKNVGGPIIITGGNNDIVQKTGKIVNTVLSGVKGGGKGRWQGKAQNWNGIEDLEKAFEQL
ncbi:hypothetical protein INT47_005088 [Mucor saturninus]|uniref:Alanyl-transfer RNA synthetases family profile domain-containing protein n=1 Tax=Mucor saturninus TaxID=64648 RepID=A0A8H7QUU3_9FUNG|nr:hypothetical protein INT47_005088 [Mucor saturninus]